MILLGAAWAHSVSEHPLLHALDWTIEDGGTQVRYEVDLPVAYLAGSTPERLRDELTAGLKLEIDGESVPLSLVEHTVRSSDHGALFRLDLSAPLPGGEHALELSNGNLPVSTALHRTTLRLAPNVDLLETSLLVPRPGTKARSDSGRTRHAPAARVTTAAVHTPRNGAERIHRMLQARPVRGPRDALLRPLYRSNRTTGALALASPLLGLTAAAARQAPGRLVAALLAVLVALDLAIPHTLDPAFLVVAAGALALHRWRGGAWWLVAPALAASLDFRGAALGVVLVQLGVAWLQSRRRPPSVGAAAPTGTSVVVLAALLVFAQAIRMGGALYP